MLHESRDACAEARGAGVALQQQLNSLKGQHQLASTRERDLQRKVQRSEQQVMQLQKQLDASALHSSQMQTEAGRQRARQQAATAEREKELELRAAGMRQECGQLRQQLQLQQASSA